VHTTNGSYVIIACLILVTVFTCDLLELETAAIIMVLSNIAFFGDLLSILFVSDPKE
jgi:hypothetical protein